MNTNIHANQSSELADVKAASDAFYVSLTKMCNRDASGMDVSRSHAVTVTALHPIGHREAGWEAVEASFNGVSMAAKGGSVKLTDQVIHVSGDIAYETGIEEGSITLGAARVTIGQRATNIYKRETGAWKLVHHHSDLSVATVVAVKKLGSAK
jgi:ketosteroid isomerase-like protein